MIALVRLMLKAVVVMPDGTRIIVREGTPGKAVRYRHSCPRSASSGSGTRVGAAGPSGRRDADDCNVFVGSARAGVRVMASIAKFLQAACGSR